MGNKVTGIKIFFLSTVKSLYLPYLLLAIDFPSTSCGSLKFLTLLTSNFWKIIAKVSYSCVGKQR